MKLLSISTDRNLFKPDSEVRARQIEYARECGETHIIVFATRDFDFTQEKIADNCFVYSTNSSNKWFSIFDASALGGKIISERQITHLTCQDPFLTGLAGVWLKCFARHLKLEIQVHTDINSPNFTYSVGNQIRQKLARFVLPRANHVRVVSERIKQGLVKSWQIAESKIEIRPIVVDLEKIKNAPITISLKQKYPQFKKIVLMASRLEPEKNILLALSAWREVIKQHSDTGLIIVGSGSQEVLLKTAVEKWSLSKNVVLESWVDKTKLYSYYKTADLFLLTSLFEGYGLTLVEARTADCQTISTDVGVAREVGAEIVDYDFTHVAEVIIRKLLA